MVPGPMNEGGAPTPGSSDEGESASPSTGSTGDAARSSGGDASASGKRTLRRTTKVPKVPGYKIESVIGRGATGVVYRARQLAVDREVALKVLHPELAGRKRTVRRLQREARTTARLAHPHIVSAIDMGEVGGRWWYAMELVDGPSLALRLRQEWRLSERDALRLFTPLCEALVHTWEHGVVHRDIKPGNILIDRTGGARLADLGLAFSDDDPLLTTSDGTLGTPHYISPEQARDPAAADVRSDILSFGATLFHAVCGRPPFAGESTAEVLSGVLYASIADPQRLEPELSRGFALVLRKCLSRAPNRRYQTPGELLADLERVRERRRPKVRSGSLDPVQGSWPTWLPWTLALAAVLLAVAGTWLVAARPWEAPPPPEPDEHLMALKDTLERDPTALAAVLGEVDNALVPTEYEAEWSEFQIEVLRTLRAELIALQDEVGPEVKKLLDRRDFERARVAVGEDLDGRLLERTGFDLSRLGDRESAFLMWLSQQRGTVEDGLAEALVQLEGLLLGHLDDVLMPEVDRLEDARDWGRARTMLARHPEQVAASAGASLAGFPSAELDGVLEQLRERLDERRAALDAAWTRVDLELVARVVVLAEAIEQDLRARTLLWGAADKLADKFAAELFERGFPGGRIAPELRSEAVAELEERVEKLRQLEAEIRAQEAEKGFDVLDAVVGWLDAAEANALHAERRYDEVVALWEDYLERAVAREFPEESGPWRERLSDLVQVHLEEARRLDALMDAAANAVRSSNGREVSIRQGRIGMTGVLDAGLDPRTQDFFLDVEGTGDLRRLNLRTLDPVGVEGLAGLAADPEDHADPADRLLSALFRFRCGEIDRARAVLDSGPLPDDALDRVLAEGLRRRIERTAEGAAARQREREIAAQTLRENLTPDRVQQREGGALNIIETLLDEYRDTDLVQRERELLVSWREHILNPPRPGSERDFRWAYAPSGYAPLAGDRVRLEWDFALGAGPPWRLGSWRANAGLELPRGETRLRDLLTQEPLLLPLRKPLELRDEELVLSVDLELRDDEPRLVIVSMAGFHVALCGPEMFASKDEPSWQVSRRGLEDLVGLLDDVEVRSTQGVPLLERRGAFRLQLRVNHQGGEVEVFLGRAGEALARVGGTTIPQLRADRGEGFSVAIRSWEQVTVTGVTLEGALAR